MMNFRMRLAKTSDIASIMQIESQSFILQIQEDKAVFLERIKVAPALFLIFQDSVTEEIVGYLSAEYMSDIPQTAKEIKLNHTPKNFQQNQPNEKKYIYISSFAILPTYRGNGTGKLLWNMALEYFTNTLGTTQFLLLVNEQWQGALHIYKNSGFTTVKTFQNFFPTESGEYNTNGILMQK